MPLYTASQVYAGNKSHLARMTKAIWNPHFMRLTLLPLLPFPVLSDHELLIANFRLKLKKVGKTTSLFKYELNQVPYNYTMEVRNRFKGLDLTDRLPDELWTEIPGIV